MSDTAARTLNGHMDEWANKLRAAGELGEYTVGPDDTAWYQASLTTEEQAVNAYQRVVDLMQNQTLAYGIIYSLLIVMTIVCLYILKKLSAVWKEENIHVQ